MVLAGAPPARTAPPQAPPPRERPAPRPTGEASLAGRVTIDVEGTTAPVRHARVTLTFEASAWRDVTETDGDGRYRFDRLAAGAYRLRVEKAGFVPAAAAAGAIEVRAEGTTNAHVWMVRGAALEGRLTGADGEAAAGIVVSAIRFTYGPAGRRSAVVAQARSDDLGRFRVHTLPAGAYYLDAAPDPLQALRDAPAAGERPPGFARTYYPGTARMSDAARLDLRTGEDRGGLDFTLTTVTLAEVSGRVVDRGGRVPAAYTVRLQAVGGAPGDVRGTLAPQGGFSLPAVPPGEYWLTAAAAAAPGAAPEFGAMRVTVSGAPIRNLAITTEPALALAGRVETDAGVALPAGLEVVALETAFDLPVPQGMPPPVAPAAVGPDGGFTLTRLFGPRLVRVNGLPSGWAIAGVWLGERSIADGPVDFGPATTLAPLRVLVTARTGSVGGEVRDASGRPGRARVVVFPADEAGWGPGSRHIRSAETTGAGAFHVEGVLPGRYLAVAAAEWDAGAWEDPEVLRRLRGLATEVTVAAGATARAVLRLEAAR